MPGKTTSSGNIDIQSVDAVSAEFNILGLSPMLCNRLSEKASRELLLPKPRGSKPRSTLKHDPYEEFQRSPYTLPPTDTEGKPSPTLLAVMASAFKGAMMTAALDLPDARKAQIGRLVYVEAVQHRNLVPVFGIPELFMSITRSADINHTPDVRTRVIIPQWAAVIKVTWIQPMLNATSVANLLQTGGRTAGIGDWRPEKGKGNYGQYIVVSHDDLEAQAKFAMLTATAGRTLQEKAMTAPNPYDEETKELLEWFAQEAQTRGYSPTPAGSFQYTGKGTPVLADDEDEDTLDEVEEEAGSAR